MALVPVKLLQESLGHVITVELKTGQTYRGKLADGKHITSTVMAGSVWGPRLGWMVQRSWWIGRTGRR